MITEEKYTVESLRFQRLFFPREIPEYLILQVKGRKYTPKQFYEHIEKINTYEYCEEIILTHPSNFLYSILDLDNAIVGYLWMYRDEFENTLFVNTLSIDKKYWGKGEMIFKTIEFLKELVKKYEIEQTLWMTTNAKFYEKFGFKRSKNVTMEHSELMLSKEEASDG